MLQRLTFFCLTMLLMTGCGRRDESLAEVKGDITFCGQPAVAEVMFEPLSSSGRTATATSAADGRFRLSVDDSNNGAKVGKHRVTIRIQQIARPANSPTNKENKLSTGERMVGAIKVVQLSRVVHSGSNQFYFRLTF